METIKCNGRIIEISHEQNVWFEKSNIRKKDIVAYYHMVAPHFLTHVRTLSRLLCIDAQMA